MRRVMVIGCPGAGKSTFSRRLREATGLPLYYLDRIWHREDRTNVSREEFDARLGEILEGEEWIVDGNYSRTVEMRLKRCDTVFLLDYPLEVCLAGARARIGVEREDMPWMETELDAEFRQWIVDFSRDQLPRIYDLLAQYREGREIIIFKSRKDADDFFDQRGW